MFYGRVALSGQVRGTIASFVLRHGKDLAARLIREGGVDGPDGLGHKRISF